METLMQKFIKRAVALVLAFITTIIYIQWVMISYDAMSFYLKYNELLKGMLVVSLMIASMTVVCGVMLTKISKLAN